MKKMTRLVIATLVVLAMAATASIAQAQQPGGQRGPGGLQRGMGGGTGVAQLLRIEKVQEEISLTEEQKEQIQKFNEEQRAGRREQFAGMRDMSPEERQAATAKVRAASEKKLAAILKPAQTKRLAEIRLQAAGLRGVSDPAIVKALAITKEQQAELVKIQTGLTERSTALFTEIRELPREERTAKMTELMEKRQGLQDRALKMAVTNVFTDKQRAQWSELLGSPFEMPAMGGRMGGRTGRGGDAVEGGRRTRGQNGERPQGGRRRGGQGGGATN